MKFGKAGLALCWLLMLPLLFAGCHKEPPKVDPMGKSYFTYFDTVSYVYNYAGDSAERFDQRSAEVSHLLDTYHKYFDIYHEYAGIQNLCTVNKQAGGEPVQVDQELIDFLLYAKELYHRTNGKMNIMMGSVLSLWHDCRTQASADPNAARLPGDEELAEAAKHTDIELLEIDQEKRTVRIADPLASIDVGAVGKGYATEIAAQYLAEQNCSGYVLNIGGNIRIIGTKPDGSDWITGIRDPLDSDGGIATKLHLADTACVTSGIYERFYTVDGVRYHHIIDPDTLYPAQNFSSITVITPDSGLADALSTALFCMSYEEGLALVQTMPEVEVLWILPDGKLQMTQGISERIVE